MLKELKIYKKQNQSYMAVVFPWNLLPSSPAPPCLPWLLFLALTKQKHAQQGHWNRSFIPMIRCLRWTMQPADRSWGDLPHALTQQAKFWMWNCGWIWYASFTDSHTLQLYSCLWALALTHSSSLLPWHTPHTLWSIWFHFKWTQMDPAHVPLFSSVEEDGPVIDRQVVHLFVRLYIAPCSPCLNIHMFLCSIPWLFYVGYCWATWAS